VLVQLHQAASPPAQDLANGRADPPTASAAADASMSRPASDADDAEESGEEYLPFIVKRSHNLAGPLFNKVPRLCRSQSKSRAPHVKQPAFAVVCRATLTDLPGRW